MANIAFLISTGPPGPTARRTDTFWVLTVRGTLTSAPANPPVPHHIRCAPSRRANSNIRRAGPSQANGGEDDEPCSMKDTPSTRSVVEVKFCGG